MANRGKRLGVLLLAAALAMSPMTANSVKAWGGFGGHWGQMSEADLKLAHGTSDTIITEDMLTNTPPADYVVDDGIHMDARDGAYNAYFPEEDIQEVRIVIDENNLNYLLQNANEEPYVMTTSVTIGDTTLGYCGLKTKGSYTLEHSYTDNWNSDRFSFTVNFGKYIKKAGYGKKQNFYGCNKISFNNFFFDKSMMKEFFALKLMEEMGLPTPQYGLAKLYINDNYYGVYAMVEALDESILEQYYNVDDDELSPYLCKPEGTGLLYEEIQEDPSPLWERDEDTYADVEEMIPTVTEWVRKLNCLSEGKDFEGNVLDVNSEQYLELLEQVMDTDEVVRYFAVHSWLCQMDNMFVGQKNFGLYISEEGVCTLLPWDYDLSFGCYYPSTAETTANYPLDVMYRFNMFGGKNEAAVSKNTYVDFPLFNAIYQNEKLMERYHNYMKECSKVAALGGTIEATGESYEPGYFYSFVEKLQGKVTEAATEKLADNVYYMNRISQPNGVKRGIPNLAKIIAMRAAGVYLQVEGIDSKVCASGCNLETLGNALNAEVTRTGVLTTIDTATGIFVTADYGKVNSIAPMLTVSKLSEDSEEYLGVKSAIECSEKDILLVYDMNTRCNPTGGYTLNVPLSMEYDKESAKFYSYDDGVATELVMVVDDNIFSGDTESVACIAVVVKNAPETVEDVVGDIIPNVSNPGNIIGIVSVVAVIVLALAGVFVMVVRSKKAKGVDNKKG